MPLTPLVSAQLYLSPALPLCSPGLGHPGATAHAPVLAASSAAASTAPRCSLFALPCSVAYHWPLSSAAARAARSSRGRALPSLCRASEAVAHPSALRTAMTVP